MRYEGRTDQLLLLCAGSARRIPLIANLLDLIMLLVCQGPVDGIARLPPLAKPALRRSRPDTRDVLCQRADGAAKDLTSHRQRGPVACGFPLARQLHDNVANA